MYLYAAPKEPQLSEEQCIILVQRYSGEAEIVETPSLACSPETKLDFQLSAGKHMQMQMPRAWSLRLVHVFTIFASCLASRSVGESTSAVVAGRNSRFVNVADEQIIINLPVSNWLEVTIDRAGMNIPVEELHAISNTYIKQPDVRVADQSPGTGHGRTLSRKVLDRKLSVTGPRGPPTTPPHGSVTAFAPPPPS